MKNKIAYLIVMAVPLVVAPLVVTTGCATAGGQESAGQPANDKQIVADIKTTMHANPAVKGSEINVSSLGGVVELSGFAASEEARTAAGQIASTTPGVVRVYNNIIVGTPPPPTPTGR